MENRGKILVVGSLNMDSVIKVKRIPKAGETIIGSDIEKNPGGKGANQAYAVGALGGNVKMLGAVGNDENGKILLSNLEKAGVDTTFIRQVDNSNTGIANIYIQQDGDNCIVVSPGTNNKCDVSYLEDSEAIIADSDILLVQLEIPLDAVDYLLERAKRLGKMVILDPAPAPGELDKEILSKVDILTPNETELAILTGNKIETDFTEIETMCRTLLDKGVKQVITTLGKNGRLIVGETGSKYVPAYKVDAVDTTATGDTFAGALVVMLSEGKSIEEAVDFAVKASAVTVQKKGAQCSIPYRNEVL